MTNKKIDDYIELRTEHLRSLGSGVSGDFKSANDFKVANHEKVKLEVQELKEKLVEEIQNSDSVIAKIVIKSYKDDFLYDTIKRFSDEMYSNPELTKLMFGIYSVRELEDQVEINEQRLKENPDNSPTFYNTDFEIYRLKESFNSLVGDAMTINTEFKKKQINDINNDIDYKILTEKFKTELDNLIGYTSNSDLYQVIKDLPIEDKMLKINEAAKTNPTNDVRDVYTAVRLQEFYNRYEGKFKESFSVSGFPSVESKVEDYRFDYDNSLGNGVDLTHRPNERKIQLKL